MAYEFNGTNQSLQATLASTQPLTLACWAYLDNITSSNCLMSAVIPNTTTWLSMYAAGHLSGDPIIAYVQPADTTAATSAGYSAATWTHAASTFSGTAPMALKAFINGGSSGSASTNYNPSLTHIAIGALRVSASTFAPTAGSIAEVGVWSAILTDSEIASLADGMTCDKVRPQSLVFYAPLVRDLVDVKGGLTITNNNTATVANHPRVYA